MSGAQKTPHRQQREAAVSRAMNGTLVQLATYTLQHETAGRYSTTLPPEFVMNTSVTPGDQARVFADLEREMLVIDYSGE